MMGELRWSFVPRSSLFATLASRGRARRPWRLLKRLFKGIPTYFQFAIVARFSPKAETDPRLATSAFICRREIGVPVFLQVAQGDLEAHICAGLPVISPFREKSKSGGLYFHPVNGKGGGIQV